MKLQREVAKLRAEIRELKREFGTIGFWDGTIECQERLLEVLRAMKSRQMPVVTSQSN